MDRRKFLGNGSVGALALAPLAGSAASVSPPSTHLRQTAVSEAAIPGALMLDRNHAVLLLTDHQVGLYTGVRDMSVGELKHNVVALAKAARVLGVPIVLTATMTDGMWGPVIPELLAVIPDVKPIVRSKINAWDDPRVVDAIARTGRRQLVIAGVSLEICATYPALSAKAQGHDVRVVLDASGTFSEAKRTVGLMRLAGAGVVVMDYASVAVEMLRDNMDPKAADVYTALDMPFATLVAQVASGHDRR